jgi:hypothetical protein
VITGFVPVEEMNSPASLGYSVSGNGTFSLACTPTSGAVGYKLYVAEGSAAAYTLVDTSNDGLFSYKPESADERMTFAVTAVNSNGTESDRTLTYYVPGMTQTDISDVVGSVLDNGKLQITVNATGSVIEYKLYSKPKSGTEYTLVASGKYPIILAGDYSQSCYYYVSDAYRKRKQRYYAKRI